jgi:Mn-dependent DtxR family transcriptional regulator
MPDDHAQAIVAALRGAPWPRAVGDIAASIGARQSVVQKTLEKLADTGVVERPRRGFYRLSPTEPS